MPPRSLKKMARKPKYFFGDEAFTSKDAVRKRAAEIRKIYYGHPAIPEGTAEYRFAEALLLNHIQVIDKIASGVEAIFVDDAPDHPTTCFWIRRSEDDPTDFGISACIDTPYHLNRASLRDLVRPQVDTFKAQALEDRSSFRSEFSGQVFPASEAVVDHDPPFDSLIEEFFSSRAENPRISVLTISATASSLPVWKNPQLAEDFLRFHESAGLRLVQSRENLSQIKRMHNAANKARLDNPLPRRELT